MTAAVSKKHTDAAAVTAQKYNASETDEPSPSSGLGNCGYPGLGTEAVAQLQVQHFVLPGPHRKGGPGGVGGLYVAQDTSANRCLLARAHSATLAAKIAINQ